MGTVALAPAKSIRPARKVPLPGVAALVLLLEVLDRELGIVLERIQGLVAEQLLDVVHVGAAADQLCCTAPAVMPSTGLCRVDCRWRPALSLFAPISAQTPILFAGVPRHNTSLISPLSAP